MEGNSNAVESSGKTIAVSAKNESTLIRVKNVPQLINTFFPFLTQSVILLSVLQLVYKRKNKSLFEAHAFLMSFWLCTFIVFALTTVVLFVDHYMKIFTNKSGALKTILTLVWYLSPWVAHTFLLVILLLDI